MENKNRISDLIDGGIQKENELFKGTRGKFPQGWEVYSSRRVGEKEIQSITIMPKGNRNSNEEIAICWDIEKIGSNGGLKFEEAEANALLISKSPQILEKLQESTEVIKWYMENSTSEQPEAFFNIGTNQIVQNEQLIKKATEL
ncbi:hypothetical protein [Empedobacter brevis]|uniref:hypothetical protein n=1 Tax=Empedobacter brevis TaxID=247 RepID=UPI0028D3198F|nr:hypothetical protein [Empedobacter brevis]